MANLTGGLTMRTIATFAVLVAAFLLTGCGGTDRRHSINPAGTTSVPPHLELRSKISAGTLHFPVGLYVLDSEDHNGYYYRAPQKIFQRSFSGGMRPRRRHLRFKTGPKKIARLRDHARRSDPCRQLVSSRLRASVLSQFAVCPVILRLAQRAEGSLNCIEDLLYQGSANCIGEIPRRLRDSG